MAQRSAMFATAIAARNAAAPHKEDRMKRATWWTLLLLTMAAPVLAQDGSGFARSGANLRAGPANAYPRVATVVGGDSLTVYGCVNDFSWCDVRWREARGWLPAGVVEFNRRDGGVPPVVAFAVDPYWDAHYRGKPWARERARWRQTPQAAPSAAAPVPEALKRQLIPSRIADAYAQPSPPPASAPVQAQWVPPGERMYQAPPPDALNPKRNKELAEQQRREEDDRRWRESVHNTSEPTRSPSSSSWWPPTPEAVAQSVQHTPPPPSSPPPPAAAQPPAPSTPPPPKKDHVRDEDAPRRRDGKQLER
jgi:uncharacterized protein YraI